MVLYIKVIRLMAWVPKIYKRKPQDSNQSPKSYSLNYYLKKNPYLCYSFII